MTFCPAVWHGDHYDAVYHQGGHHHHGWGRKLMGANNVESVKKADGAQHGGWGGYGGYGGHDGGHYDYRG